VVFAQLPALRDRLKAIERRLGITAKGAAAGDEPEVTGPRGAGPAGTPVP
jgi:hypothetical protein